MGNTIRRWKLIDYWDVWFNEDDGYWVNDVATVFDDLYIADDASDREIFDYLKDVARYSRLQDLKFENVEFDGDEFIMEISTTVNDEWYPLCRLERVV